MRMPRSLRALTLIVVAALLMATIGTGVAIFTATQRTIIRLVDERIAAAADAVTGTQEGAQGPLTTRELLRRLAELDRERDTGDIGTMLTDAQGRRIGGNIALPRPLPPGRVSLRREDGIKGVTEGRALTRDVGRGRRLSVIAETEPLDRYGTARLRIYLIGFGSILGVVAAGVALFAVTIGRRIAAMRATAEAIIDGDMRRRVPLDGDGGTFDRQAEAFNRMLDRIDALMRAMSNVSNDIAHDLRSPLARLRGQLTQIERRAVTPEMRAAIETAIEQSDQILALFAAILRIAEVEGGARRAGFAELDLGALGQEIGAMMMPVAEDSGHRLLVPTLPALPVRGDRQLLTQALINLIENACRHTPPGTCITLGGHREGGAAVLTVADAGPGIPAEDRALALRRFGRLDRSRAGEGHGLGLPLVAAILRLHRGEVRLEDAAPGLRVILTLRLAS